MSKLLGRASRNLGRTAIISGKHLYRYDSFISLSSDTVYVKDGHQLMDVPTRERMNVYLASSNYSYTKA